MSQILVPKSDAPASPPVPPTASPVRAFHIMTKPVGPICNLDCKYCFYLEKENLYPDKEKWRMPNPVLEQYIKQYIEQQDVPEISFAWQGGEPTLLGVKFFRRVVEIQQQYANGKTIHNAFQTNGTLLDDEWCEFFSEQKFLIGLSIDGPRELHDKYRVDKHDRPTFDNVMRGVSLLKKHKADFNTLTVVNRANSQRPLDVYRFLKEIGSGFMQFIPLVERLPEHQVIPLTVTAGGKKREYSSDPDNPIAPASAAPVLDLAEPPLLDPDADHQKLPVTAWSVEARTYGEFLCKIFDEWVRNDVGQVFVQLFDVTLGQWMGLGSSLCVFAEKCGTAMAMEHNGDLYACDHYVYPRYKLGNVMTQTLSEMASSEQQRKFGSDKFDSLPQYCMKCEYRFACNGECPKHRFMTTPDGEPNLNYLCPAYKRYFAHVDAHMKTMAALVHGQQPAALIMDLLRNEEKQNVWKNVQRNDPCPCGSGKKYKKCCEGKVVRA